jgi:hypothetical protein
MEHGVDLAHVVERGVQLAGHGPHSTVGAHVGGRRDLR